MDPVKSRRWIAAAALAAAVVFLVMVTGERGPAEPNAAPAPVSSSEAVLASDGGPPDDGAEGADRAEVIDAMKGLLDALGISAEDLADGADCGNGGNGGAAQSESDDAEGADCGQSDPAAADPGGSATITISGFAFGQPLTVAPGATVEVVNTDAAPHNVTAADGSFETPDLAQDETATFTAPNAPGRYEFTCTLHPEMAGTLIVEGDAGGSSAGDRAGDQGRTRSTEPPADSQRGGNGANTSGGDHDRARSQHQTTVPGRENANGSSDGY
jgi:plastocyanin